MKAIWIVRIIAIALFLAICWFFLFSPWSSCNKIEIPEKPFAVYNPALGGTFSKTLEKDTVFVFVERIQWKELKPETVYYTKIDTVLKELIKSWDVMLSVRKIGRSLYIYAYNENDSLIKQYIYEDVGNNFIATSATDRIVIKSQRWYFSGITAYLQYSHPVNSEFRKFNALNLKPGITTGFNYNDRLHFDIGAGYQLRRKEVELDAKISFKLN